MATPEQEGSAAGSPQDSRGGGIPKAPLQCLCDVFDQFAESLQLPLGSCKPVVARASTQPRGRLRPQLVSEYLRLNVFKKLLLRVCIKLVICFGHLFCNCFAIVLQLSIVLTIVLQLFEICAFF